MLLSRREWIRLSTVVGMVGGLAGRQQEVRSSTDWEFNPENNLIHAPSDPCAWPEFRRLLNDWRKSTREKMKYSASLYERAEYSWACRNFACGFVMLNDQIICDVGKSRYTVGRFLSHARAEFGGFDSVVLWHAYPRLGLDARNQFDFYREQPGGLPALRRAVDEFHRAGVKVFLDYNPWDTHTRREGRDDIEVMAELLGALNACLL
ncbi:MAG: hypothetical protein N3G20_02015, partial [Verrucomicrobiae bacterium]|nr:hypothetical protein [Verrucomicrobiae bacterium]